MKADLTTAYALTVRIPLPGARGPQAVLLGLTLVNVRPEKWRLSRRSLAVAIQVDAEWPGGPR